MSRPRADEWDLLGEPSDPVPGDSQDVAKLGRSMRKTAESIRKQADEIKALSSVDAWKSKAADEFRKEAEEAEGKLRKAFKRYDTAADALGTAVRDAGPSDEYASELQRAQDMADKALRDAQDADAERKANGDAIAKLPKGAAKDDPDRKKLEGREDEASAALGRAKKALQAAKEIRDQAAKKASEAIHYAIDHDGLKDGTWDKFKDWVHDNSGWINEVLKWSGRIATVCGTLALFVGWIPIIGQALAGILGTVALIMTTVSLVGHLALAMAGEGSWFDVALDVVGIATLGIGRGAMAGAKGAMQGAKSLARTAAFKNAVSSGMKTNKAWKVANRLSGGAQRGKAGAEAVRNAPKGWFPGAGRMGEAFSPKAMGKEVVESFKDLKAFKDVGDLRHASNWSGTRFRVGDSGLDDLGRNLDEISPALRLDDAVKAQLDVFETQTRIWQGSTAVASSTDLADKGEIWSHAGMEDGLWAATGIKESWTTSDG
ncbi:putative T7SS-secreted protein [Streptomyces sp. A5-4]|uniref:putative T7SS-secreted protein n=1 Tax=Streptomyces sp. A5-4 TaxID=3384771 RepID=UPI003DA897CD